MKRARSLRLIVARELKFILMALYIIYIYRFKYVRLVKRVGLENEEYSPFEMALNVLNKQEIGGWWYIILGQTAKNRGGTMLKNYFLKKYNRNNRKQLIIAKFCNPTPFPKKIYF